MRTRVVGRQMKSSEQDATHLFRVMMSVEDPALCKSELSAQLVEPKHSLSPRASRHQPATAEADKAQAVVDNTNLLFQIETEVRLR
jgi:hypothetical protein